MHTLIDTLSEGEARTLSVTLAEVKVQPLVDALAETLAEVKPRH